VPAVDAQAGDLVAAADRSLHVDGGAGDHLQLARRRDPDAEGGGLPGICQVVDVALPGDPLRQRYRLAGQVDDVAAGGKAHEAEVHGVDLTRGGDPLLQVVGEH